MGVSKNNATPKSSISIWMVYSGRPYWNGWFGGTPIFGNTHMGRQLWWKMVKRSSQIVPDGRRHYWTMKGGISRAKFKILNRDLCCPNKQTEIPCDWFNHSCKWKPCHPVGKCLYHSRCTVPGWKHVRDWRYVIAFVINGIIRFLWDIETKK